MRADGRDVGTRWSSPRTWPAGFKLACPVLVAVVAGLAPPEAWPALGVLGVIAWLGHAWSATPLPRLVRRCLQFAPWVVVLGAAAVWSRPTEEALVWSAALVLRCYVAFLAGLWLVEVLTVEELLSTLARWRCPAVLITTLSFLLRYLVVLWEEAERMRRAQQSRAGGPPPGWASWIAALQLVGALVLRALERAERAHRAMLARGWTGGPISRHEAAP